MQGVVLNIIGVEGEIFTEGALVHPAVGKDEEVLRQLASTDEWFIGVEKNLGVDDMNVAVCSIGGHLGDDGEPLVRGDLQSFCGGGGFASDANDLNEKAFDAKFFEQGWHTLEVGQVHAADGVDEADVKTFFDGLFDTCGAGCKDTSAADGVVDLRIRAIQ